MKHIVITEDAPLASIIVPAYNAERFMAATLDSLVKQMLKDIEIIVVNDGSTDNTENVVKSFFFDRRIRYVKKENGGTGDALNVGHRMARGKYVTWCSADNVYFPNFALELVKALQQCELNDLPISFVYSDFIYIDANGRAIEKVVHQNPQQRSDLVNGYDLGISFMYTMDLWKRAGEYWNRICEDYHWAVRAAEFTEFGLLKGFLAAFRVHGNQITGSNEIEEKEVNGVCRALASELLAAGKYKDLTKPAFSPVLVEDPGA